MKVLTTYILSPEEVFAALLDYLKVKSGAHSLTLVDGSYEFKTEEEK